MRSTDPWTAWLRRVDVRVGAYLAMSFAPLVAGVLFVLYGFAAAELLELVTFDLDERLEQLASIDADPDPSGRATKLALLAEELALDGGGYRILDERGGVLASGGAPGREGPGGGTADGLLRAVRLRADDELEVARTSPSGHRVVVYVPSAGFVRERDEILQGFWISLVIGIAGVSLIAIPATRRALAPLRRATDIAESVDAAALAARLPTRGTRDDVDRHALAVNRLLDRLEQGFARLSRFSQDVAHELRTPVHRILNTTELRLLEPDVDDAVRADLETIRSSADQMARLVDGLLLIARGEGDQLALRRKPIDVADLLKTLQDMYEPACEEASVRLEVKSDSAVVSADPSLLLRALGNLIDNALAHTPAAGSIAVRARARADEDGATFVEVVVEDSGPGVPPSARDRIFERFVRLGGERRPDGLGLGLPIARVIVRAHGGDIALADVDGEGGELEPRVEGARFVVWLPIGGTA